MNVIKLVFLNGKKEAYLYLLSRSTNKIFYIFIVSAERYAFFKLSVLCNMYCRFTCKKNKAIAIRFVYIGYFYLVCYYILDVNP